MTSSNLRNKEILFDILCETPCIYSITAYKYSSITAPHSPSWNFLRMCSCLQQHYINIWYFLQYRKGYTIFKFPHETSPSYNFLRMCSPLSIGLLYQGFWLRGEMGTDPPLKLAVPPLWKVVPPLIVPLLLKIFPPPPPSISVKLTVTVQFCCENLKM